MNYQQGYRPPQQPSVKRSGKRKGLITALLILLALAVIGTGVFVGMRIQKENARIKALNDEVMPYSEVFSPNIYVDGIHLGGMSAQQGIDAVVNQINTREKGWSLALKYKNHTFYTLRYDDLGVSTDIASVYSLLEKLYQKGKLGTLEERKAELDELKQAPCYAYTTQSDMTHERLDDILRQIKEQLTSEPVDAYLAYFRPDLSDPFIIQNEQYGSTLDIEPLKEQILEKAASGESGVMDIQPTPIPPKVTAADVCSQVSLRAKATTPVSSTSTVERTSNIRTAFSHLNGQILEPGAKLSFNKITLDRTLENGYKYAIEYESGMEKMGIGGGVCQASTTLYLAALKSDLEIVSRISHSDPVSYTVFGQDATVYYNRHDLVFRNTSGGTIYITARVNEKRKNQYECEVCIYGPSLGDGITYTLRTETVQTLPAPVTDTYVKDTKQEYVTYSDQEPYLVRKARDGFVNETYLQKWYNSELVSEKFVSRDTCKARENIYYVGTQSRP